MNKCSNKQCCNPPVVGKDCCVLHDITRVDGNCDESFYEQFYEYLKKYTINLLLSSIGKNVSIAGFQIEEYLESNRGSGAFIDIFNSEYLVCITKIKFPENKKGKFDYSRILQKLPLIEFKECVFEKGHIHLGRVEYCFNSCKFLGNWTVGPAKLLENDYRVMYRNCKFEDNVCVDWGAADWPIVKHSLFGGCEFCSDLKMCFIRFACPIFLDDYCGKTMIKRLDIESCFFDEKFILNNAECTQVVFKKIEFNKKFEIKYNQIGDIAIKDCNFNGLADFYESIFGEFEVFKCIFRDFSGFENCHFGSNFSEIEIVKPAIFKYATFKSFVNLRNTVFTNGLDFRNTNTDNPPNFLGTDIDIKNTDRETFRIVNYSFDSIGNTIEANKFYVMEMRKYRSDLQGTKKHKEKFILAFNDWMSAFGFNYVLSLFWIFTFSVFYTVVLAYSRNDWVYEYCGYRVSEFIGVPLNFLNLLAENVIPYKSILEPGIEFASLLFYVVFTSLIWQTIVAVKRHTKR